MANPSVRSFRGAQLRFRKEPSYGSASSADWFRINANTMFPSAMVENEAFIPQGAFLPTISILNDEFTESDVEGVLDFNSIIFILASLFGEPVTTNPSGTAYQHVFTWDGRAQVTPVSYEVSSGYPDVADTVTGWVFTSLGLSGGRADGFELSGSGFGKPMTSGQLLGGITNQQTTIDVDSGTPDGGTFTLTAAGQTTAAIDYNESAANIAAALNLVLGAGTVTATGGPLPSTPVVLTFGGQFAGQAVVVTIDNTSVSNGTYDLTETTPADDEVADIPPVPAGATIGDIYLDDTWSDLGNTQLLHCYSSDLQIDERMVRVRPINSSFSSDDIIDNEDQEPTLELNLGVNAVQAGLLAALKTGAKKFFRLTWTGPEIEPGHNYLLQIDGALIFTEMGSVESTDSVATRTMTGRLAIDDTNALQITVVNTVPDLEPTA